MVLPQLTESSLRSHVSAQSLQRGKADYRLGLPLAKAILSLKLSPTERKPCTARLTQLVHALGDSGMSDGLNVVNVAVQAARYGWEAPAAVEDAEDAEEDEDEDWEEEDEDWEEEDDWKEEDEEEDEEDED